MILKTRLSHARCRTDNFWYLPDLPPEKRVGHSVCHSGSLCRTSSISAPNVRQVRRLSPTLMLLCPYPAHIVCCFVHIQHTFYVALFMSSTSFMLLCSCLAKIVLFLCSYLAQAECCFVHV